MFVKALKVWWYKFTAKKGWIFFSSFKGRRQVPPSSSPRSAIPQYFKLQRTLFYTSFTCFTKMLLLYYSFTKMFWNKKCCNEILMYFLQTMKWRKSKFGSWFTFSLPVKYCVCGHKSFQMLRCIFGGVYILPW